MVKLFLVMAVLILTIADNCLASDVIQAEIPTAVKLSNRDINRIVCPGPMSDLIFSQEKGMTGHFSGNNGFIKFKIDASGTDYEYANTQSELFVVCNNAVYTLLVTPMDIPSVTLRLVSPAGDSFKKNIDHYQKMPLEKQALLLIEEAYHGNYPTSYRISEPTEKVSLTPDLETELLQIVDVDGVGLRLKKYLIKSLSESTIDISEQLFLSSSISKSILAVALDKHSLEPNQSTMVFVVDQKERVQ